MHALARRLVLLALAILWTTATPSAAPAQDIVLVRDGKPAATIVVADRPLWKNVDFDDELAGDPRINPRIYAEELQFWIERATGARLPIVPAAKAPKEGTLIVFGESVLSKKLGFDCRNMPPEGVRIVTFDRGVALLGDVFPALERGGYFANRQDEEYPDPAPVKGDTIDRSVGHATFEFLETYVGYRFYFGANRDSEEEIALNTVTPKVTDLRIPAGTDYKKHPDFLHRAGVMGRGTDDPMNWYRCFRTGASIDIHANHTHTSWHRVYGDTHPEVFALDKDGVPYYKKKSVRPPFRSALNYAHPKTLELQIEHIEYYDRTQKLHNGWRAYATPNKILATPADGKWYDYSKEAAALSFPEGDLFMQQSDVYWDFIARLARIAQKRWPERMVVGSAYNRRMCPPTDRVTLPDNVACQMALCRSSAMTVLPVYREWLDAQIERWHELLGRDRTRFGVWDYFCWPHGHFMAPVAHPHRLQEFLREHKDKIGGVFVNPSGKTTDYMMVPIWHKLLWDVDTDVDAVISEHCRLFYGPAGPFIEELYTLTARRYENTIWTDNLGVSSIKAHEFFGKIYPQEVVTRMKDLFDKAFAAARAADDPIYLKRLHAIYDAPDTERYYSQDGWEAFFRSADHYFADRPRLTAERVAGKPDWTKIDSSTLFKGTHISTAKPVMPADATTVRTATDGKTLRVRIEAGASEELARSIFADGVALKFFEVPGAKKRPDADIEDEGYFMPEDSGAAKQNILVITVDNKGVTNFKNVTAAVERDGARWTAEVTIPYALLGIDTGKRHTLMFDVRRLVTLKTFAEPRKRGRAWEGLPADPPQRIRVEYALSLKEGLAWHRFNPKKRAARLVVK